MSDTSPKSYPALDRIQSPLDLKGLDEAELENVCREMRAFLLESVQETGGTWAPTSGSWKSRRPCTRSSTSVGTAWCGM